jgi:hypothetical protein
VFVPTPAASGIVLPVPAASGIVPDCVPPQPSNRQKISKRIGTSFVLVVSGGLGHASAKNWELDFQFPNGTAFVSNGWPGKWTELN